VTIEHDHDLPPSSIRNCLHGIGFVIKDEDEWKGEKSGVSDQVDSIRLKGLHLKHCQICQTAEDTGEGITKAKESTNPLETASGNLQPIISAQLHHVNIESAEDCHRHAQRIYISVSGMTCASCVGAVTRKIEEVVGASEVAVDFIGKSAVAVISRKELTDDVVMKIEEAGFEAEVVSSEPLLPPLKSESQQVWAADLIIHEISSTYVEEIRTMLRQLECVHSVDVVRSV
jgi:P-type Cu+ transporter